MSDSTALSELQRQVSSLLTNPEHRPALLELLAATLRAAGYRVAPADPPTEKGWVVSIGSTTSESYSLQGVALGPTQEQAVAALLQVLNQVKVDAAVTLQVRRVAPVELAWLTPPEAPSGLCGRAQYLEVWMYSGEHTQRAVSFQGREPPLEAKQYLAQFYSSDWSQKSGGILPIVRAAPVSAPLEESR